MHSTRHDAPTLIGDPVTAVRPGYELAPDAVRAVLRAPSIGELLELLGITGVDREELLDLLPRVTDDDEVIGAVTSTANLLRTGAGLEQPPADLGALKEEHTLLQQRIAPGEGLVPILAHVVSSDVVRAWHAARGMSAAHSWDSLADLGQQMRVHRLTYGVLGLHTLGWTALNWTGRLFTMGRLQFDLHREAPDEEQEGSDGTVNHDDPDGSGARSQGRWVIGTHIPATGPLDPAAVEESLAAATDFFTAHFGDLGGARAPDEPAFGHEFTCQSWLVSDELARIVEGASNLARFAALWEIEERTPGADDAAFFVFHARPPYDPQRFPRTTRLERGVAERLADGRGWESGTGRLVR